MLSQFVTAAKGLFARRDSTEDGPSDAASPAGATHRSKSTTPKTPNMVTATTEENISPSSEALPQVNGSGVVNGKRKSGPASSAKMDGQSSKRRKKSLTEESEELAAGTSEEKLSSSTLEDELVEETVPAGDNEGSKPKRQKQSAPDSGEKNTAPATKAKHFRFGSEEPDIPMDGVEEIPETQQEPSKDEDSDDDEAPEAFSNAAQLQKMKEESRKQEQARQKIEQLQKEKRRQLDERRKQQAKLAGKTKKEPIGSLQKAGSGTSPDDILSESTATLQGSTTQDTRRPALPALLPDEILNAVPVTRPPTPPPETDGLVQKKSNKLKFLDKVEKPPKDIKHGSTTIRVLEGNSSGKKAGNALAPKISKVGRNIRESWIAGQRGRNNVNGLRRVAGGPSSFVRS